MGRRFLVAIAIAMGLLTFTHTNARGGDLPSQDVLGLAANVDGAAVFRNELRGEGVPLERGRQAVAALEFDWATALPGWTIEFHDGRDDLFGLTHTQERRIEVFVRKEQTPGFLEHVVAHELGHAIDVTHNSTEDRERWQEARDIGDSDWWPGSGATDFATGAGDFAESFAVYLTGPEGYRSELGEPPNEPQLALIEELSKP